MLLDRRQLSPWGCGTGSSLTPCQQLIRPPALSHETQRRPGGAGAGHRRSYRRAWDGQPQRAKPADGSGSPGLGPMPQPPPGASVPAAPPHLRALSPRHCMGAPKSESWAGPLDPRLSNPSQCWAQIRRDNPVKCTVSPPNSPRSSPLQDPSSPQRPRPFSHQQSHLPHFFLLEGGETRGYLRSSLHGDMLRFTCVYTLKAQE